MLIFWREMNMKLPYKVMSTAALSVIVASIPVIVHAKTGDFYNQTKQLKYAQADLRSNKTLASKLQDEMDNGDTVIKEVSTGTYLDYLKANDAFVDAIVKGGDTTAALNAAMTAGATTATSDELDAYPSAGETTTLAISSVSAINNTKIKVTLKDTASASVTADKFIITKNSDSSALVVSSVLKVDGKDVYLRTAAQSAGQLYTVKTTTDTTNTAVFAGRPVDTTAPTVSSAQALSNTSVKIVFSEPVDADTATVAGNYAIAGLTLSEATIDTTDTTGSTVILTTSAQTLGTAYTVVVANVTDVAENKIGSTSNSAQFAGKAVDTTAPALATTYSASTPLTTLKASETSPVRAKNNITVEIIFNEKIDPTTAQDVANYTIPGLTVQSATLYTDTDSSDGTDVYDGRKIVLTTSTQSLGTAYTLTIAGVKDLSGNAIAVTPATTAQFAGKGADTTAPTLTSALSRSNITVRLQFGEELDLTTAQNAANYTIPGLTVSEAKLVADANGVNTIVDLTTSPQTVGTAYTVTVVGVKDLAGNVIIASPAVTAQFAGKAVDTTAPTISSAVASYNSTSGATTVKVVFSEPVDTATATSILNYSFDNNLGYPVKA